SLVCQHIGIAPASLYHHAIFQGGQFQRSQVEGWLALYSKDPTALMTSYSQPFYNDFWSQLDALPGASRVNVPGVYIGGWYDTFLEGTIEGFRSRQLEGAEGARGKQKLVIGPWTHHWPLSTAFGDFQVPEAGRVTPVDYSPESWFAYHLKGEENAISHSPAVTYFLMGPFDGSESKGNVWRSADAWPPPSRALRLFLHPSHTLEATAPAEETTLTYLYDPNDPVPTIGGHNLFLEAGPKDQRPIESRSDVLVFSSQPLSEDLEVAGRLNTLLTVSSNRADTDYVVRLSDVYPDGRSILIADGIVRLAALEPEAQADGDFDKPRQIAIPLGQSAIVFAKGHAIRLSVSSSNYPRFERNSNRPLSALGDEPVVAENRLHFGGDAEAWLELPVTLDTRQ
ncbi:MAG: CocE/NonD family hydrolase, partial [Chlamydiia bacterium]|nr:CocE/NonD family hydrolase [Chlamydiia bacterium]